MAELTSPKQQSTTVSVDQEDQQRKGDDYERRAANEVNGWAVYSGDYEKAIQLLGKACSFYKPSKAFDKLGGAHMKVARCYLKMGSVEEGASAYVAAAKYYKKIQYRGAVTCLSRAAMLFEEIEQLSTGRYYQELGDICEAECNISQSIGHYRKAAELYLANESNVLSNQCRTKVAKHAAELERSSRTLPVGRYAEAVPIFEALAKDAVSTGASKKTVKEMFQLLRVTVELAEPTGMDHRCPNENGVLHSNIDSKCHIDSQQYLATAFEKRNRNLYTEVLNTHEVLFRNDALARLLANRCQKNLNSLLARSKTTTEHSPDVQQPNFLMDELRLDEAIRDSTKEDRHSSLAAWCATVPIVQNL